MKKYRWFLENGLIKSQVGCRCTLCHLEIRCHVLGPIEDHVCSTSHKQKLNEATRDRAWESKFSSRLSLLKRKWLAENYVTFAYDIPRKFRCNACNCVKGTYSMCRHIESKQHVNEVKRREKTVTNDREVNRPCTTTDIKNSISIKNTIFNVRRVPTNASSPSNRLSVNSINSMLNNLMNLNLITDDQKQLSPLFLPKKPSPSNKNIVHHGQKYIEFCIEPGPCNIYNVDPNDIHLMKLGITLMFPLNSQQMCIACDQQLLIDKVYEHLQESNHIKYINILEENEKSFANYPGQFSDLRLAKQYMVEVNKEWVNCYACDTKVNNNNVDIALHAEMSKHITKIQEWSESGRQLANEFIVILENLWYYSQVFFCEICNKRYDKEIDFVTHLVDRWHEITLKKLRMKGVDCKFDVCPVCVTYWFGQVNSHESHCQSLFHVRFADSGDFSISKMSLMTVDLLENVDARIANLIVESDKVQLEKDSQLKLLKAVENTVKPLYPDAKAYIFGSRLSKLDFPDSKVDILLDCHKTYNYTSDETIKRNMKCAYEFLGTSSKDWIVDEISVADRVPILKLGHIDLGLKCDVAFSSGLSVEKSILVRHFNDSYPMCRALTLYLQKWLTSCKLVGTECISTFATSWLVIFYLQTEGILPSIYSLISLDGQSKLVDGWKCSYTKPISIIPSNVSFKSHLMGLFSYYANFDYKTDVICPYLGTVMKKRDFAYFDELPKEYTLYKCRLMVDDSLLFRFDLPMCMQDPIELSHNLTEGVKKLHLRSFIQYCKESYVMIKGD